MEIKEFQNSIYHYDYRRMSAIVIDIEWGGGWNIVDKMV